MKRCSCCKQELSADMFNKRAGAKDGLDGECKSCKKKRSKERYQRKKASGWKYENRWAKENPGRKKEKAAAWNKRNAEHMKEWRRAHYRENKDKILAQLSQWRKDNPEKVRLYHKKVRKRNFLAERIRARIGVAIRHRKSHPKCVSTVEYLGCGWQFYREYLESKFTRGMSWEKLEKGLIHIDHIVPISSFDMSKESERLRAFNWQNTQPLWAEENQSKYRFMPENAQLVLGVAL